MVDDDAFGGTDPPDNVIPFPGMRPNAKLSEAWAKAVEEQNKKLGTKDVFLNPEQCVDQIIRRRSLPLFQWPATWPQLAERCRAYAGDVVIVTGPTGAGKCLGPEVEVLKHDGSIVRADQVEVGDLLIGPDSTPRRVLSTTDGTDQMFRIRPVKGGPWTCNSVHVLTLVRTDTDRVIDVPLNEYLGWSKTQKNLYKLASTGVEWQASSTTLPVDPWFVGIWYGDGTKELANISVTTMDPEVVNGMATIASAWGLRFNQHGVSGKAGTWSICGKRGGPPGQNGLLNAMRELWSEDRLPARYLTASRADRLEFLAGLLDSDGHLHNNSFEIISYKQGWALDIAFLARSLGLRALIATKNGNGIYADRTYWRVSISGHTDTIPNRVPHKKASPRKQTKDVLRTGFSVEPIGVGPYFGWTLDGDGRFLLGDFTVTHNTSFAIQVSLAFTGSGIPILWCALELDPTAITERIVANLHGVHTMLIKEQWSAERIKHSVNAVTDMWHFVPRIMDVGEQLAAVRRGIAVCMRTYRIKPLVVVDYLGKLAALARDIRLATIQAAELIRALAVEEECYVLLLAQPSRAKNKALTGTVEHGAATDTSGAAAESGEAENAASIEINLEVFKEDDAEALDARWHVAKSRHVGREGQTGARFTKAGGVWAELDYVPAHPLRVKSEEDAQKKDKHRTEPPQGKLEVRKALNVEAAGDAAAKRRATLLAAIRERGMFGLEEHAMKTIPGAGRGLALSQDLTELSRSGAVERAPGRRWKAIIR